MNRFCSFRYLMLFTGYSVFLHPRHCRVSNKIIEENGVQHLHDRCSKQPPTLSRNKVIYRRSVSQTLGIFGHMTVLRIHPNIMISTVLWMGNAPIDSCNINFQYTLQGTNISHLWKRKIIFKMHFFWGYVSSLEGS